MYQFTTTEIAGLSISKTVAAQGTDHKKRYMKPGVTPDTQNTLNVYISGQFELEIGGVTHVMSAGQTSLDLPLVEYQPGEVCTERVLTAWGTRACISAKVPWSRSHREIAAGAAFTPACDCLLVLLRGELSMDSGVMRPVSYRLARGGSVVTAASASIIVVCKIN